MPRKPADDRLITPIEAMIMNWGKRQDVKGDVVQVLTEALRLASEVKRRSRTPIIVDDEVWGSMGGRL